MLASLKIENVAVIEKAEVNFTPGFNVLTGETGAGKSILIDSINAILGNRTSRELVRSGAQKACIWATFESIPASVKKQLEKCGYEVTDDLLLYREINAEGKGSCRVNGMPATAAVVRDISSGLLSIHGQHDSQSLTNPALHLGLLDQYAQNRDLFAEYYRRYRELVTVKRQLDALNASESDKQRRIEALTAEIDTIDAAALQPGEEKTLQERKNVITHAQSILAGITAAHLALAGDEDGEQAGAADLLGGAVDGLQNSARLDESLTAMSERLNDLYYSARELATDLADRLDAYGFDAGELDQIETRLDTIYRIKQKFGMEVDELLARREAAAAELETFQSSGQKIAELKAQMQTLYAAAKEAASANANAALEAVRNGLLMEKAADNYDNGTYTDRPTGTYSGDAVTEWVFNAERQEGDLTLIESGDNYYVVLFHSRGRNDYNTVDVRHILFKVDTSDLDSKADDYQEKLDARKAEQKEAAEAALKKWEEGARTEDSFAELANELSADTGSNTKGGLYTEVYKGQMVTEFNDWCFDESRQPGDTGIVYNEGSYTGYHVIYFVGTDAPYWQVQVRNAMKNADYTQWNNDLVKDITATETSGMKYLV